jgi:predicted phage terminase large subunit-like protein
VLACGVRIAAYGAGSALRGLLFRGLRPDLILLDDPEDDSCASSHKRRQTLRAWCERALLPALDSQRGSLVWLGTVLHHDSVLARWIEEKGESQGARREAPGGKETELADSAAGAQWHSANAPDPVATKDAPAAASDPPPCAWRVSPCALGPASRWSVFFLPALDNAGQPVWPGRWTAAALDQRRRDIGDPAFAQEYLLRPASAEAQRFQPGDFLSYDPAGLARLPGGGWQLDGAPLTVVAALDPAAGLSGQHDYSAVAVVGFVDDSYKDWRTDSWEASDQLSVISAQCAERIPADSASTITPGGERGADRPPSPLITDYCSLLTGAPPPAPPFRAYVLEIRRLRGRFDDQLQLLADVCRRWQPRTVGVESVAYQSVLQQQGAQRGLPVEELKPGGRPKEWRIEDLSTAAARGALHLPLGVHWVAGLTGEAYAWPNGAHDDQLDALAWALERGGQLLEQLRRRGSLSILGVRGGTDGTGWAEAADDSAARFSGSPYRIYRARAA